jgi:two-component system chemotaxis response regulator CheB
MAGAAGMKAVVTIGSSTGGPSALTSILKSIPGDIEAGFLISQHMPKTHTEPFAERLNEECEVHVKEAEIGDVLKSGWAFIAPGGFDVTVTKRGTIRVAVPEKDSLYQPSIDKMMCSVAGVFGEKTIGVILTGMGNDGLRGLKAIKAVGGRTIAQDEKSSVVYGMNKVAIKEGCIDFVKPLSRIAAELLRLVDEM